jgi:hypothetical protein
MFTCSELRCSTKYAQYFIWFLKTVRLYSFFFFLSRNTAGKVPGKDQGSTPRQALRELPVLRSDRFLRWSSAEPKRSRVRARRSRRTNAADDGGGPWQGASPTHLATKTATFFDHYVTKAISFQVTRFIFSSSLHLFFIIIIFILSSIIHQEIKIIFKKKSKMSTCIYKI